MPFTAAKATFAFSALVKILRLLSLIVKPFFMTGYSLNYCPDFGDHYKFKARLQRLIQKLFWNWVMSF
jgi:hypothetical protein